MTAALTAVPAGHVAAVVTYLEMHTPPAPAPVPESSLRMERWAAVDPDRYRALFRAVGARWLWFSRLAMDDAELLAKVAEVHGVTGPDGADAGFIELDFRVPRLCTIRFLGLVPALA